MAEKVPTLTVMLAVPYSWFERVRLWVAKAHGEILDEDFGADVTVSPRFPEEYYSTFHRIIIERSAGRIEPEIVETNDEAIMPIGALGGEPVTFSIR
jgi:putative IMPACT (imprinted ancient) family translation regulator